MFNFVIDLLKKPRSERTETEDETICNWFIQNFRIFSKINKETVDDIVNNSRLCECESNSLIIKQGDPGDSFFLILDGRVSIFINTDAISDPSDEQTGNPISDKEFRKKDSNDTFLKVTDKTKYGNFIGFIEAGSGFGEMALISDDVRSATIISEDDCLFLTLDKNVYNRSLRLYQETEFKTFTTFVNTSPIFENWAPRYKKQVSMSLTRSIFPFDRDIIKQGDKIDGIGFIVEGQAKVVMDITLHSQQYPDLELSDQLVQDGTCNGNESLLKSLDKVKNLKHLEISLVGPGEIIGDIERAKGLSTSCKSLTPIEPTEVYFLSEKNFERLVTSKRNQATNDLLRKWVDQKLLCQFGRPIYRQIPFMIHFVQMILNERLKIKEQLLDTQIKKVTIIKSPDFIIRGPLIDMYGPGTVFYRNRQLRQKKKNYSKPIPQKNSSDTNNIEMKQETTEVYHNTGLQQDPTFLDWETSASKLDTLETKILTWYESDIQNNNEKANIPRLQRFIKKENGVVKPGKTILLKPKKVLTLSDLMGQEPNEEIQE